MVELAEIKKMFEKLVTSTYINFPIKGKIRETEQQGVYIIYNKHNKVFHVGKTNRGKTGLNQRLQNHINGNSSFVNKFFNGKGSELRNGYKFKYIIVKENRIRALLEAYSIGTLCPQHIGTGASKLK